MISIPSAAQIKQWDAYTIQHEPITSVDLMERASKAFVEWYTKRFDVSKNIVVICGTGNNGGDGLAIARLLNNLNYKISVNIIKQNTKETEDFKINRNRLGEVHVAEIQDASILDLSHADVIIDALFGSGLTRAIEGIFAEIVRKMNEANAMRIAVDVPSGLFIDSPTSGISVKAHHTVSFQTPKLAFLLPQNFQYVGEWHIVDIGLSKQFLSEEKAPHYYIEKKDIQSLLKLRTKYDHKGTHGKALLIAGSYGKIGAAVLAARAIMRTGAGLLTTHVPGCGYEILQSTVPESMVSVDTNLTHFTTLSDIKDIDAIGIGPGLGQELETKKAFQQLLERSTKPLVMDADALNLLATHRELLSLVPVNSILTPHPGEFERLVGKWRDDFYRLQLQKEFSRKTGCVVILKGAHTSISAPDGNVYFNSTGNPGMATGGSGDVLTGILTSLLAQGYEPVKTALLGVYLHGLAGDIAASKMGYRSLVASDIIDSIAAAYRDLEDYLSQN